MPPTPTKDTKDEPKLTLPIGHPKAGYVEPDLSYHEGTGLLPDDEIEFHEERNAAREEDLETIEEGEDQVAREEIEARDENAKAARERLEKVASGEITPEKASAMASAQSALDAMPDEEKKSSASPSTKSSS